MSSTLEHRTGRRRPRNGWRAALAVLGLGLAASAGCKQYAQPEPLNPTDAPIVTDEAMAARDWELSRGYWADSHLVAYPTRFPYTYQSVAGYNKYTSIATDAPMFVYQTLRLPYTLVKQPPGTRETYAAVEYEPSYTVMPPLNPESAPYHDPSQRSLLDRLRARFGRDNAANGSANAVDSGSGTGSVDNADRGPGAGMPEALGTGDAPSGTGTPSGSGGTVTPGTPAGEPAGTGPGTEPPTPAIPGGPADQPGAGGTPAGPADAPAGAGGSVGNGGGK